MDEGRGAGDVVVSRGFALCLEGGCGGSSCIALLTGKYMSHSLRNGNSRMILMNGRSEVGKMFQGRDI
jgi:hypothetical protein